MLLTPDYPHQISDFVPPLIACTLLMCVRGEDSMLLICMYVCMQFDE